MKLFVPVVIAFLYFSVGLLAQSDSDMLILTDSKKVKPNRYKDVKGSPFLFENWVLANIVSSNIDIYENLRVNYNGDTKSFEILRESDLLALDKRWCLRVEIYPDRNPGLAKDFGNDKLIFQKGIHPRLDEEFSHIIYAGNTLTLIRNFEISTTNQKIEPPGGTTTVFKRFVSSFSYYLIKEGELISVKPRKNSMIKALGKNKAAENFIQSENIDFSSAKDLAKLLAFYDKGY